MEGTRMRAIGEDGEDGVIGLSSDDRARTGSFAGKLCFGRGREAAHNPC